MKNYTQKQLSDAFDLVKNSKHWKNPINKSVVTKDPNLIIEAVIHFTGSVPLCIPVKNCKDKYSFKAAGYYATIGS